jgi:hypothetical protein
LERITEIQIDSDNKEMLESLERSLRHQKHADPKADAMLEAPYYKFEVKYRTAQIPLNWGMRMPNEQNRAGKRKPSKTRKGNKYLRSALIEASQSVCRSDNYLGSLYRRIAARKGGRRAAVAFAHAIMKIVYLEVSYSFSCGSLKQWVLMYFLLN